MNIIIPVVAVSPLRQRLIDEMEMRRFCRETQRNYIRDVGRFATFLGRSPDTATAEDVRRFQVEQSDQGVPVPTMNSIVSALRFFFLHTIDRPDLARKLVRMKRIRKLPVVLNQDEVARLLDATTCLKHQAALSVACGARASAGLGAIGRIEKYSPAARVRGGNHRHRLPGCRKRCTASGGRGSISATWVRVYPPMSMREHSQRLSRTGRRIARGRQRCARRNWRLSCH